MTLAATLDELVGLVEQAATDRDVARGLGQLELPEPDERLGHISEFGVLDYLGELGLSRFEHWTTDNLLHILLTSDDVHVRLPALAVFRRVAPRSLKPLTAALRHRTPVARWLAAQAIGWMGPAAKPAQGVLRKRLAKEVCGSVRERITWALGQVTGRS
jgi:hypothetical protein